MLYRTKRGTESIYSNFCETCYIALDKKDICPYCGKTTEKREVASSEETAQKIEKTAHF